MKKSRFTEEQIVFTLKQAELGTSVPDVCRKLVSLMPLFTRGAICEVGSVYTDPITGAIIK